MKSGGNEFLPNYVEYLVPLTEPKKLLPKKLGIIALAAVLFLAVFISSFTVLKVVPAIVPFLLFGVCAVVWYLWRFVSVEYEYTVLQGEMTFDVIYGRRQRKTLYTAKLNRVTELAPVGEKRSAADFQGITREYFFAGAFSRPGTWYAVVEEEKGGRTLVFFEMTEKTEKVLRFYQPRAFLNR